MSAHDDGGPAFPHVGEQFNHDIGERETVTTAPGLSVRDYFAAKALAGMLANPEQDYAPLIDDKVPMLASEAYRLADAMLEARKS